MMKAILRWTLAAAVFAGTVHAADTPASNGKAEQVGPGVWRIRLGAPEELTPTHFRTVPAPTNLALAYEGKEPFSFTNILLSTNARGCSVQLPLGEDEQVFGLGLNSKALNMTGRQICVRPGQGSADDWSIPAPFYVTSSGYGVLVDSARYVSFNSGARPLSMPTAPINAMVVLTNLPRAVQSTNIKSKTMLVEVPAVKGVDIYVFGGPSLKEAVQRYNLYSGGAPLPPLRTLGIWYLGGENLNGDDITKLVDSLHGDHIPLDMWGMEAGWQQFSHPSGMTWHRQRFPQPLNFIKLMSMSRGLHLSGWTEASLHPSAPPYPFALQQGGAGSYLAGSAIVPDFTVEISRSRFGQQLEVAMVDKLVESFKIDDSDIYPGLGNLHALPDSARFPSGLDGEQMQNLLPVLHQQLILDSVARRGDRPWNSANSAHAFAAPLACVLYNDRAYDHRAYVRTVAQSGFSGFLWTPQLRDAVSLEDLCRRAETMIFSAQAVINCSAMTNPPWVQFDREKNNHGEVLPNREEVTSAMRQILQFRATLVPYIYSAFVDYHTLGLPPFRAVAMDYPQDTNAWNIDDEFLVGPSLLVAPMFAGQKSRAVYLPQGEWFDFWTGEHVDGGKSIDVSKPLDQIPVYVKSGAILPLAKPGDTAEPETFELTVRAYGANPQPFSLYEDDGASLNYLGGAQNRVTLKWTPDGGKMEKSGTYKAEADRYKVTEWKAITAK